MKKSHHWHLSTAFLLSVTLSATVLAHDTWLIPKQFSVKKDTALVLDMSSGMAFPDPFTTIKPERIVQAKLRLGEQQEDLSNTASGKKTLRFNTRLTASGIAAFWVELKPKTIELSFDKVATYLHELGTDEAKAEWDKMPEPKRWRETYSKHAKTFVKVDNGTTDATAWSKPVGLLLEIVPETNPTAVKVGDDFTVQVLKHGQPLPHFAVGIAHEGEHKHHHDAISKTDELGKVTFHFQHAGRWLLRGIDLQKSTQANTEWESHFTTLSIQVKPNTRTSKKN